VLSKKKEAFRFYVLASGGQPKGAYRLTFSWCLIYKAKIAATMTAATLMAATTSIVVLLIRRDDVIRSGNQEKGSNGGNGGGHKVDIFRHK
jgi:hypothetical protein